jgi:6-phosphofructo-2-kinase/fructose-2,6-biphosphatase 2
MKFFLSKEVKLKSPDYTDVTQEEAVADFLSRIQQYEKRYEPIDDVTDEKHFSFIKIFNCGERFLVHKIGGKFSFVFITIHSIGFSLGHIQSRVVYFLMNIHVTPRTIYLTRVNDK